MGRASYDASILVGADSSGSRRFARDDVGTQVFAGA